jgi:5'-3' exoribonuclease 1
MGIPRFFRWLSLRYPVINQSLEGDREFDNFYLDMNGIIHTCTHNNDGDIIFLDEVEMFARIFAYTDRLYRIVKPRKFLFLAVDGVAPRAKMNQQRSRRFRSAKEAERVLAEAIARGDLEDGFIEERFDSNCITPGTAFRPFANGSTTKCETIGRGRPDAKWFSVDPRCPAKASTRSWK